MSEDKIMEAGEVTQADEELAERLSTDPANIAVQLRALLERQLASALDVNAVFCISCGQPDEPDLHDDARCPGRGGKRDALSVAEAVEVYDQSCEELPDLDDDARALHCAMLAFSRSTDKPVVRGECGRVAACNPDNDLCTQCESNIAASLARTALSSIEYDSK